MPELPVFRLVFAVDTERYSARGNADQLASQYDLDAALRTAASRAGLDRDLWQREVGGDGELCIFPVDTDVARVLSDFTRELDTCLSDINRPRRRDAWLRLRLAFHYGLLIDGPFGPAGSAPIVVSRLLGARPLREALAEATQANLALIVSQVLYDDIVLSGFRGLAPADYRQVRVVVREKNFDQPAYVHVPGGQQVAPNETVLSPARAHYDLSERGEAGYWARSATVSTTSVLFELVDRLLDIHVIRDPAGRERVIGMLPGPIAEAIPRHPQARLDVFSLLRTCLDFPGGVAELVVVIQGFDSESLAARRFAAAIEQLSPPKD
jgi:hypothetical protein